MRSELLMVARQAGTAAAFAPLAKALHLDATSVYAYPPAAAMFEREGVSFVLGTDLHDAMPSLTASRAGTLLTGTSLAVADDARWWSWARSQKMTSMAFVDQWCNYRERFVLDGALLPASALPDRFIVVDDVAANRMAQAGFPTGQIVVAGTPALDRWFDIGDNAVDALAAKLRDPEDTLLVLYVCEPDPAHWTSPGSSMLDRGFQARIEALGKAAAAVAATRSRRVKIIIKPHPIQLAHGFLHPLPGPTDRVCYEILSHSPILLARVADAVVGHSSVLLHESASWGKATIALLEDDDPVCDIVLATPTLRVSRHASLTAEVSAALAQPAILAPATGSATVRFLSALGMPSILNLQCASVE
jgi:hypothetical protein